MTRSTSFLIFLSLFTCKPTATYYCTTDEQCKLAGRPGRCVDEVCALSDSSCPSGYRYHESAGDRASQCVPVESTPDLAERLDLASPPDLASLQDMTSVVSPTELTWTPENHPVPTNHALRAVWGSSPTSIYAVGNSGLIIHSTGTGTWSPEKSDTQNDVVAIWGVTSPSLHLYAVTVPASCSCGSTCPSSILHSTGDGKWTPQSFGPGADNQLLSGIWGSGSGDLYTSAGCGKLLHSTGGTWNLVATSSSDPFHGVCGGGAGDVYLTSAAFPSTSTAAIWHSNGASFSTQNVPGNTNLFGCLVISSKIYAAGIGGISASTGNGSWTMELSSSQTMRWVWASGPTDIYAVGLGGVILHSAGDGKWTGENSGTSIDLLSIWGSGPKDVYVVGYDRILHGH